MSILSTSMTPYNISHGRKKANSKALACHYTKSLIDDKTKYAGSETEHIGKNEGKNIERSKLALISHRLLVYFFCLSIFQSVIMLSYIFSANCYNRNSSDEHVFKLNVFLSCVT